MKTSFTITEVKKVEHDKVIGWDKDMSPKLMARWGRCKVYVWCSGEDLFSHLRRFDDDEWYRQHIKLEREVALAALSQLGEVDGELKLDWSQKAGCRCGCSPAFIVRGATKNFDVHIHATINRVVEPIPMDLR